MSQPPFVLKIIAQNGAPVVNSSSPIISGGNNVGDILSVNVGTWSGAPIVYVYQWRRNGINITRANSDTYEVVVADSGTQISCLVTAYNCLSNSSYESNFISIV